MILTVPKTRKYRAQFESPKRHRYTLTDIRWARHSTNLVKIAPNNQLDILVPPTTIPQSSSVRFQHRGRQVVKRRHHNMILRSMDLAIRA